MDKYTVEMALFEIWGALQIAETMCDFSKVRTIAKKAMNRAGLLEEEKMGNG